MEQSRIRITPDSDIGVRVACVVGWVGVFACRFFSLRGRIGTEFGHSVQTF